MCFFGNKIQWSDSDTMYKIGEHILFRNDAASQHNERPCGGTAVYTRIDYYILDIHTAAIKMA